MSQGGMMSFLRVADIGEILPGKMKLAKIGDKEILIVNVDGSFFAIPDRCTHAGGDLSKGILEGKIVTCPRHGSQFDVTTGRSLRGPKIGFVRFRTRDQPSFRVKIEGKVVMVDID